MGKLREQMQMDLQLRGITPRTQATYLREVRNLALYFKKSPEELGERELKEYLLYLINDKKLPEGTYRNYYSGLKFLYKHTLKREWVMEKILCPKRRQKLPLVLDLSEVEALFSVTKNLKHKAILMITYSSGLRVSEAARLKVDRYRQQTHDGQNPKREKRQRPLQYFIPNGPGVLTAILDKISPQGVVV